MRKRSFVKIISILIILLLCAAILNFPLTTKQGINGRVRMMKIPFYIKIAEFLNRDYHYRMLVKDIVEGCEDEEERVLAIFKWVYRNIKTDIPEGWPIVDDHIWYTIVRGYGVRDQLSDAFATLCVYAGFDTRLTDLVYDRERVLRISAVKLKKGWAVFDPFHKIYFKTPSRKIATVRDLLLSPLLIENQTTPVLHHDVKYSEYFKDLAFIDFDEMPKPRAYRQNFFKRIFYEMKRVIKKRKN